MKLHPAMTIAERIQRELAPFCEPARCEIVGSLRRARPEVNDVDLVVIPKPGQLAALKERCKQRCRVIYDGDLNFITAMMLPTRVEFQLDIFVAHAGIDDLITPQKSNWGSLLVARTGSKQFNQIIARTAKNQDKAWKIYDGIYAGGRWQKQGETDDTEVYVGGQLVASETEEQIFEALGLKWMPPAYREINSGSLIPQP